MHKINTLRNWKKYLNDFQLIAIVLVNLRGVSLCKIYRTRFKKRALGKCFKRSLTQS